MVDIDHRQFDQISGSTLTHSINRLTFGSGSRSRVVRINAYNMYKNKKLLWLLEG